MPKIWNPRARNCSECKNLKSIITDKKARIKDLEKKRCSEFGWEIENGIAQKMPVSRIELPRKRRKRGSR